MIKIISSLIALLTISAPLSNAFTTNQHLSQKIEQKSIDLSKMCFKNTLNVKFKNETWASLVKRITKQFILDNNLDIFDTNLLLTDITCNGGYLNINNLISLPSKSVLQFVIRGNHDFAITNHTNALSVVLINDNIPNPKPDDPDHYQVKTIPIAFRQISIQLASNTDFQKQLIGSVIKKLTALNDLEQWNHDNFKMLIPTNIEMSVGAHQINCSYSNAAIGQDYYIPLTALTVDYTITENKNVTIAEAISWLHLQNITDETTINVNSSNADILAILNEKLTMHNNASINEVGGTYGSMFFGINDGIQGKDLTFDDYINKSKNLLEDKSSTFHFKPSNETMSTIDNVAITWIDSLGGVYHQKVIINLKISKINLVLNPNDQKKFESKTFLLTRNQTSNDSVIKHDLVQAINSTVLNQVSLTDQLSDSSVILLSTQIDTTKLIPEVQFAQVVYRTNELTHYNSSVISLNIKYVFQNERVYISSSSVDIKFPDSGKDYNLGDNLVKQLRQNYSDTRFGLKHQLANIQHAGISLNLAFDYIGFLFNPQDNKYVKTYIFHQKFNILESMTLTKIYNSDVYFDNEKNWMALDNYHFGIITWKGEKIPICSLANTLEGDIRQYSFISNIHFEAYLTEYK